jgi:hypothetical protein
MTPAVDGTCEDCKGKNAVPFVLVSFGVFCMICAMYYVFDNGNRATQPHSMLIIGVVEGMMITSIQHMGVFSNVDIPWSDPLKILFNLLELAIFDIDVLQLGCVTTVSPFYKFVLRLSAILAVLNCIIAIHVCYPSFLAPYWVFEMPVFGEYLLSGASADQFLDVPFLLSTYGRACLPASSLKCQSW